MVFQFFFKQMETSPALQEATQSLLSEKIERYVTKPVQVLVTFSVQKGQFHAHCHLTGGDGFSAEANALSEDMYQSLDIIADRLVSQLKKHKEILKEHKGQLSVGELATIEMKAAERENALKNAVDAEDLIRFEQARVRRDRDS